VPRVLAVFPEGKDPGLGGDGEAGVGAAVAAQVHKFSKFIHGTATLLPELVQAVPYWVDDESVRPSMLQSAPQPPQPMCAHLVLPRSCLDPLCRFLACAEGACQAPCCSLRRSRRSPRARLPLPASR
jgi:hypothetical protein